MPWHDKTARKVLIAEDDNAIRDLLVTRLEIAGYHTADVKDGHAALDLWRSFGPQLAILDINMPRLDGFGVLERLRRLELGRHVPIMMLTARKSRADVERARALGAREYMVKPFSDQEFLHRVAKMANAPVKSDQPANKVFL